MHQPQKVRRNCFCKNFWSTFLVQLFERACCSYIPPHFTRMQREVVSIYGQESPGWIYLKKNLSLFLFWKYPDTSIFLVSLIGQWIPDGKGRGIARAIKNKYFIFETLQKMVTKLRQFKKLKSREGSRQNSFFFLNRPTFVTIFVEFKKLKCFFFLIALAIPCPLLSEIHWLINWTKKVELPGYKKKKVTSLNILAIPDHVTRKSRTGQGLFKIKAWDKYNWEP